MDKQNKELEYDENGIPYCDPEEQKELEEILKDPECHEIASTTLLTLDENFNIIKSEEMYRDEEFFKSLENESDDYDNIKHTSSLR